MNDGFSLPDGRWLHPFRFTNLLVPDPDAPVRQFQLTQEREDLIRAQLVVAPGASPARLDATRAAMQQLLGPQVELHWTVVPRINLGTHGKFRVFRSKLGSAYDGYAEDAPPA